MAELASWEGSKENVQPLKRGRDAKSLQTVANAPAVPKLERKAEDDVQRAEFEAKVTDPDCADPLAVWFEYIKWAQDRFLAGDRQSGELVLLERATKACNLEKYKNDPRYIRIWVLYCDKVREPLDMFKYMWSQEIGVRHALLYEAWALQLERERKHTEARKIYEVGIARKAEPLERLQKRERLFEQRMRDRLARAREDGVREEQEPERAALNPLTVKEARGLERPVNDRRQVLGEQRGNFEGQRAVPQKDRNWSVMEEAPEAAPVAGDPFAGEESWGQAFPSETSRRSQNAQDPSPWNSVKLKQKVVPSGQKLDIFVDDEDRANLQAVQDPAPTLARPTAPRLLDTMAPPTAPSQAEGAKRAERAEKRRGEAERFACDLDKIVSNGEDVSFEELRAAAYMEEENAQLEAQMKRSEPTVTSFTTTVGEVTMNRVSALVHGQEPTVTTTGAFNLSRGKEEVLQLFCGDLEKPNKSKPVANSAGPPPDAQPPDRPSARQPGLGVPAAPASLGDSPLSLPPPRQTTARPKPKAAFSILADAGESDEELSARPKPTPSAFFIPDESTDAEVAAAARPRSKAAFTIPDFADEDSSAADAGFSRGATGSARPAARPAFEIPEESTRTDLVSDFLVRSTPAFPPDEDTSGSVPQRPSNFSALASVFSPEPDDEAQSVQRQSNVKSKAPPDTGLRDADIPVWGGVPPTPGENTHFSVSQSSRALFAESDFLRRGPRLSFDTPGGPALHAPQTNASQLLASLEEPSPAAGAGEDLMSDDKENDGHGPADPRAVDHGRALQTLSTDNRSDGDEIPVDAFTSDGLGAALDCKIRENRDEKYAFTIFEDAPSSHVPTTRAIDCDPSFLQDFPAVEPKAREEAQLAAQQDAQSAYRRMRFSGPLYEHAAWDRTERALAFPTGRAFQLEARASGPGRWLASEVGDRPGGPAREHAWVLQVGTDVSGLTNSWCAKQQLTARWESYEEVHVRVADGVVVEAVGIAPAACPLSRVKPGSDAALFALRDMCTALIDLHSAQLVHSQICTDAFVVRGSPAGPILVGTLLDACRKEIPALCPADVDCAEVFGNALWSYQVDLIGVAFACYRVLTGRPPRVRRAHGLWQMCEDSLEPFWDTFFKELLNLAPGAMTAQESTRMLRRWRQDSAALLPGDYVPAS
jgi:checkpoint serine/threonine-protein kinase